MIRIVAHAKPTPGMISIKKPIRGALYHSAPGGVRLYFCRKKATVWYLRRAQRLLQRCGSDDDDQPGGTCFDRAKAIFAKRRTTSNDEDINDALRYCRDVGRPSCLESASEIHFKRRDTNFTQDINEARQYCYLGGSKSCLESAFAEYQKRSSTTTSQDVADAKAFCLGD